LDIGGLVPTDRHVEGMVEMMLDATFTAELRQYPVGFVEGDQHRLLIHLPGPAII
jgi:hypothetical protein